MKNIYIILLSTILFASCGKKEGKSVNDLVEKGSMNELRAKKVEITTSLEELNLDLKSINTAISKLDTVKKLPLITVISVKDTLFNHYLEIQGNVLTRQNVLIYPETQGLLKRVLVKEGQRVSKGQLLATVDDGGLSQQLAQAEAQAQLAKTTYERQKRLWDQKIGSEIQYLQAKTNYEALYSSVSGIRQQLQKSSIRAPFSGVIDEVSKEVGTLVSPGQGSEIFRIVNLKNMYIEAEVPESYITNITKGKKVEVYFPVLGETVVTKVKQVGNYINPANRTFKIEIEIPNRKGLIKPNLTARLKINDYSNANAILIPQNIISENANGEQYVYTIEGKTEGKYAKAKKTIIETGKTQGDLIEVVKYIAKGAEIVSEGARSVNDGQKVEIKNN